jgi:hypothetical protein
MNYQASLLCAALVGLPGVVSALDLTPKESVRELEGVKIPIVTFSDGRRQAVWQPPVKWQMSGKGRKLMLYPPNIVQAAMQLEVHPRTASNGQSNDAASPEDLEHWAQKFLPQDCTEMILLGTNTNPFNIGSVGSTEFTFTYLSQSRRFSTSVAVTNISPLERLAMIVTAHTADFAAVHDEALASMFRWNWRE